MLCSIPVEKQKKSTSDEYSAAVGARIIAAQRKDRPQGASVSL